MGWRDYWNSDTPIYVNERHRTVHYDIVARDILALMIGQSPRVLDFGCGEALSADRMATRSGHLYLCDGAPLVRNRLLARFPRNNVTVLAPEELGKIPPGSLDLVVINSVIQYLTPEELDDVLARLKPLMAPSSRLVVADVIPPSQSPVGDAVALLALARRHGFFVDAVVGLVRTLFSGYLKQRAALGLSRYTEDAIREKLGRSGFSAERRRPNIGHNQGRMMFVASVAAPSAPPQP